ncbi:hypothetical protein CKAN_01407300 [Cinnamomum micranthum f. kanehirae]|uniref:Uncharacterized protein n=1 Tax=Cinnamomum micranthum f. kanehirae TaxID=337451 RepID=A0A3S3MK73_9MAGN|nr:hypothetical protein CKAN_01407300 [Cinnamomum micranthum f. kanehirae]
MHELQHPNLGSVMLPNMKKGNRIAMVISNDTTHAAKSEIKGHQDVDLTFEEIRWRFCGVSKKQAFVLV